MDTRSTDGPGKIRKALRQAKLWKSKAIEAESNTTKVEYSLWRGRRRLDICAVRKYVKDGVNKRSCVDFHNEDLR